MRGISRVITSTLLAVLFLAFSVFAVESGTPDSGRPSATAIKAAPCQSVILWNNSVRSAPAVLICKVIHDLFLTGDGANDGKGKSNSWGLASFPGRITHNLFFRVLRASAP